MRRLRYPSFAIVFMLTLCLTLPLLAEEKAEETYTIKQGDTLWEISSKFLKDPFLWPKLWQRNPYITNPHWIYPGRPVRLTPVEEAKKEEPKVVAAVAEEKLKPPLREEEVKKAEPPPIEKKVEVVAEAKLGQDTVPVFREVRSAGFFSDIDYRGIGIIVESKEGKTLMANGDIVYVTFKKMSEPILIGNKYTAFRQSELGYPETEKKVGYRYNITGNIQIIDQYDGHHYTAKVLEAFQEIYKWDMLRPYLKEKMEIGEGKK